MKIKIAALCTLPNSVYKYFPGIEVYDKNKDAYSFNLSVPIIAHPPCAQWSRMHKFSKADKKEKDLAVFCFDLVNKNGGVFEHPAGSHFFDYINADHSKIYSVDQHVFNFPARKRTYLYFSKCKPLPQPLNFNAYAKGVADMHSSKRSYTTAYFANWLIQSILKSTGNPQG
jgi:hypothetical protein